MKKEHKRIQAFLFIVGILLILITYFYYPSKNKSLVEKNIQENVPPISDDLSDDTTSFENIEYQGQVGTGKEFLIKAKKADINQGEPDKINLSKGIHVILYLEDGRTINIYSDFGVYFKSNYDLFLSKNVRAEDVGTKL